MKADAIENITARIEAHLNDGVAPWVCPWSTNGIGVPTNAVTGAAYRGLNNLSLTLARMTGHTTDLWLTYKQAEAAGGHVRKGEKGHPAIRPIEMVPKFNAAAEGAEDPKKILLFKGFTVFNLDQCEALDHLRPEDTAGPRVPAQHNPAILAAIAGTGAVIHHGGDQCYYRPSTDQIQMVEPERFVTTDHYYATTFHELGHWTGAKHRLNRFDEGRPKLKEYAYEELVAELTSAFCCQAMGVDGLDRHNAAYIGAWLKGLQNDRSMIAKAAADADRARKIILPPAP